MQPPVPAAVGLHWGLFMFNRFAVVCRGNILQKRYFAPLREKHWQGRLFAWPSVQPTDSARISANSTPQTLAGLYSPNLIQRAISVPSKPQHPSTIYKSPLTNNHIPITNPHLLQNTYIISTIFLHMLIFLNIYSLHSDNK